MNDDEKIAFLLDALRAIAACDVEPLERYCAAVDEIACVTLALCDVWEVQ